MVVEKKNLMLLEVLEVVPESSGDVTGSGSTIGSNISEIWLHFTQTDRTISIIVTKRDALGKEMCFD